MNNISYSFCDFSNEKQCSEVTALINQYIADPMGGGIPLSSMQQLHLIDGLANHPACFVLFILINQNIAGLATCFINFSTFKAKPYINIHDLIIDFPHRGKGLGKSLLQKIESIAVDRKYCKITLEVREDNFTAQKLYNDLGFKETSPSMYFRTKEIV